MNFYDKKITVAIVVLSDSCYKKINKDISGKEIQKIIKKNPISQNWKISHYKILPDNKNLIKKHLLYLTDNKKINFIITSGGTGITKRDVTPEATKKVIEKEACAMEHILSEDTIKKIEQATKILSLKKP
jgi:molybdenum cofactor synthesis domain-containing protein